MFGVILVSNLYSPLSNAAPPPSEPSQSSYIDYVGAGSDATMGDGVRAHELHPASVSPLLPEVCPDGEVTYGIDVSKWQGTIDWAAVAAAGVEYAFIRVSDGSTVIDEFFEVNWQQAKSNGIVVGAYQFFRPGQDPVAQADLLLSMMGTLGPEDLPPVIDIEVTGGLSGAEVIASAQAWIDVVEADVGAAPLVYTAPGWWDSNVGLPALGTYPLWVASWGVTCPAVPTGWSDYIFHQFSATGTVSGISGDVDENYFNGSSVDLDAWTIGPSICGDGVCVAGESPDTCPEDCPLCGLIPTAGATIDNDDPCYELYGDPIFWRDEVEGYGGSLLWTQATALASPENYAIWRLYFEQAGTYDVEIFTTSGFFDSTQANYEIRASGTVDTVLVDQSALEGWFSLGDLNFDVGGDQWIRLNDNTGEPGSQMVRLGYDAIRLTPTAIPGTTGGAEGGETSGGSGGDGSTTGATGDGMTAEGGDTESSASSANTGDVSDGGATGAEASGGDFDSSAGGEVTRTDEGCACHARDPRARPDATLLLLLLPAWAGRARRHRMSVRPRVTPMTTARPRSEHSSGRRSTSPRSSRR